jgi:hypothetical protein
MRKLLYSLPVLFLFASCVKNNPDPAWIEILPWTVENNPNLGEEYQGSFHNFSNAWVYVDNDLMGVFELPVKIPVLKEGAKEIRIYPAILNNGISATKKIYPFVEVYASTVELVKNETLTISPVTRYKDATKFWIERFEDASVKIEESSISLANLQVVSSDPILVAEINEGSFGRISLNTTNNIFSASTTANANGTLEMPLPKGKEVYLEIDYYTTNSLVTGVLAIGDNGTKDNTNVQINAQDPSTIEWKRIYIQLDEIVSLSTEANRFEFSLNAILDEGETATEINIDNIKAVYF